MVLAAATAVVGFGLGEPRFTTAGQVPDKEMPAKAAEPKKAPPAKTATPSKGPSVSGRVLSPDGKPLAGAKLLLIGKGDRPVELGTSAAEGRFDVTLPADWKDGYLVARAEGVGIDFAYLGDGTPKGESRLRTVADNQSAGGSWTPRANR